MPKRKSKNYCSKCPRPTLYPENTVAFELFIDCLTQFEAGPMGPIGLKYSEVMAVAECSGVKMDKELLGKIKTLEIAYLEALHKNGEK